MTAAERCDLCSGCRSIHACRRKCGLAPEAAAQLPPPVAPRREACMRLVTCAAILVFIGFTGGLLALVSGAAP